MISQIKAVNDIIVMVIPFLIPKLNQTGYDSLSMNIFGFAFVFVQKVSYKHKKYNQ